MQRPTPTSVLWLTMARSPDEIARWQSELSDAFRGPRGLVGERLCILQNAERHTQTQGIGEFKGFVVAADACIDFAIESLDILARPPGVYHIVRVPLLIASVSRLRSSYILFWMGYYFDAASLLRGIFENVVHLSADAHGWFDISSRFDTGGTDLTQAPLVISKKLQKLRQAREANVVSQVYGTKSGLTQTDQDELAMMVKLMHSHVHETEMHLVHLISEVRSTKRPVSLLPSWNGHQASHYPHISLFLAWALARLLSHAVPQQQRSPEWMQRRDVLDRSLRFWFEGWDKPLGPVIIRFIDTKFTFAGEWAAPGAMTT